MGIDSGRNLQGGIGIPEEVLENCFLVAPFFHQALQRKTGKLETLGREGYLMRGMIAEGKILSRIFFASSGDVKEGTSPTYGEHGEYDSP